MMNRKLICVGAALLGTLTLAAAFYKFSVPDIETPQNQVFSAFDDLERLNAYVVGKDGKVLGKIKSGFDTDALGNEYGAGASYKSDGLFCTYSKYGSTYDTTSAFCKYATDPPRIAVKDGSKVSYIGVLTVCSYSSATGQKINPHLLKAWLQSK